MSGPLPFGLNVTLYPEVATWGALREFVRMADALNVPDETKLACGYGDDDELGIQLGAIDSDPT